jgi:hypothetical protein
MLVLLIIGSTVGAALAIDCSHDEFSIPGQVGVKIYFQEIHALAATDGSIGSLDDRDEVYIRVIGRTEDGSLDARLPYANDPDDYYEFFDGTIASASSPGSWSNKNQHKPYYPEIWEGQLTNDGDRAEFLVVVMEQDNEDIGKAKQTLGAVFGACGEIAGDIKGNIYAEIVAGACKGARELSSIIPENDYHDLIGAFLVTVENNAGELQTTYLAADGESFGRGTSAVTELKSADDGDPFLAILERELEGNAARFDTRTAEGRGRYSFTVVAEPRCVGGISPVIHKLWNDDVERGTCRGGKQVDVQTSQGERRPISVGETIYLRGDGNRDIEYWCVDDFEHEDNLFDRIYEEFAVERTSDKINYYPYSLEPYTSSSGTGAATSELLLPPQVENVGLERSQGVTRVSWGPNDTVPNRSRCDEIIAETLLGETVPLIGWYSPGRGDNTATSHGSWLGCEGETRSPDYRFSHLHGLLYSPDDPQPANTIALYSWYSPSRGDNWTTTLHKDSGSRGEDLSPDYAFVRLEGYLLSP